MKAYLHFHRT